MATINKDTWIEDYEIPFSYFNTDMALINNREERVIINTEFVYTVMNGDETGIRLETAGLTKQELYALDILKILVRCVPAEQIAEFKTHWESSNYCDCEFVDKSCLIHFASQLTSWIFNTSGFNDDLMTDDDDIRVRMKNWRSQMTKSQYKAIKKYIIADAKKHGDARWADYIKLLDGKPSSLFDYSTGHWLVAWDGEPW